jgi:hypothetical protein
MRQRGPKIAKQWAVFFGLMIALQVAWFLILMALEQQIRRSPSLIVVLVVPYLIALFGLLVLFFRRLGDASSPPEYREAKANGVPATAKVLEIRQTRWHTKRRRNFRLQTTPRRWEYEMRLKVSRSGMPDYEAELAAYLDGSDVPKKGAIIDIKVHPQHPEVVVMAQH